MKDKDEHSSGSQANSLKGTFIIKVEHCQHNSWQGKVVWAEENKKVAFRSELELINLMNEALEHAQKQSEKSAEHSVS